MSTHYLCEHCGTRFPAGGGARVRCPGCMRRTSVVPDPRGGVGVDPPKGAGSRRRRHGRPEAPGTGSGVTGAEAPGEEASSGGSGRTSGAVGDTGEPTDTTAGSGPARRSIPGALVAGVVVMGATAVAVATTDFSGLGEGERLGTALTYAALGGLGSALAAIGGVTLWRSR